MRNAKSMHYFQVDHSLRTACSLEGIEVFPSKLAWERYSWTRNYFPRKPEEGYFIWVRRKTDFPLQTCIAIEKKRVSQHLVNLLVIEKGIKARANAACFAKKKNLFAKHISQGIIVLKEKAILEYSHLHRWGRNDLVETDYTLLLKKDSKIIYTYQTLLPPKVLKAKTVVKNGDNSSSNLNLIINGVNSKIEIEDSILLEGNFSQAVARLRIAGRENSRVSAHSKIIAKRPGKGHLDCQGILVDNNSEISLTPQLVCQNKKSQITHEASIGKISEEELNYLRMRGLTEKEAIDLILDGFLMI